MKPAPEITDVNRPYFEAARDERLVFQRCGGCAAAVLPPSHWCPYCWSPQLRWEDSTGQGRVVTYTVVHQAPSPAFAAGVPYVLAIVSLAEGLQLMANIVDADPQAVAVDSAVRVVFERRGEWAVPQFTLVG